jgi:hypothetical protein
MQTEIVDLIQMLTKHSRKWPHNDAVEFLRVVVISEGHTLRDTFKGSTLKATDAALETVYISDTCVLYSGNRPPSPPVFDVCICRYFTMTRNLSATFRTFSNWS